MKFNYKLNRVMGAYYGCPTNKPKPNMAFINNSTLLSPCLNRIQIINLNNHNITTLPFESRSNIKSIALPPVINASNNNNNNNDRTTGIILVIDENDYYYFVHYPRGVILHRGRFRHKVRISSYSPCSKYLLVAERSKIQLWTIGAMYEFQPLAKGRLFVGGFSSDVSCIDWSRDGSAFVAGSRDATAKLFTREVGKIDGRGYVPLTLGGHRDGIVGAFLADGDVDVVYTISRNGAAFTWKLTRVSPGGRQEDDDVTNATTAPSSSARKLWHPHASYTRTHKHYFHPSKDSQSPITCCSLHSPSQLLSTSHASGHISLYELPSFAVIHTLSLSRHPIPTITLNPTGEWLAAGLHHGQLSVWEWKSETFTLKQIPHGYATTCFAFHPKGRCVATGGEDGKIKLWNDDGFNYVTMAVCHTARVTAVTFGSDKVVLSASLDGSVRAYDLTRYKNFRVMTGHKNLVAFGSLACSRSNSSGGAGESGEVVAAGTMDHPFEIYVWGLANGRLLEVLAGHKGPVVDMEFGRLGLMSASWDKTLRVWDIFGGSGVEETFVHGHDVVCCALRPDGKVVVTGMINGVLSFWDVEDGKLLGEIDGQLDIKGGRKVNDRMTSNNNASSRYFTSVCYSADGTCVLAGGNSKYVCIYEVSQAILLKKFVITNNRSLDGILEELNSKNLGDGGPIPSTPPTSDDDDDNDPSSNHLPGAKRTDDGTRRSHPEAHTVQVAFSPTGREWATISPSEGLHLYSLDDDFIFDPIDLTVEVTPATVQQNIFDGKYATALRMSLQLNERELLQGVIEATPHESVMLVVRSIHHAHLERFLGCLVGILEAGTPHLEFYVDWCLAVCQYHGTVLQKFRGRYVRAMRALYKAVVARCGDVVGRKVEENGFLLEFLEMEGGKVLRRELGIDERDSGVACMES